MTDTPPAGTAQPRTWTAVTCALALGLASVVLGACRAPQPTPPVVLPILERPVVALPGPPTRGNVVVPDAALVIRAGIPGVFVLSKDGQARFRMIRTGKAGRGRQEVLSGLAGDETLVVGDLNEVRDGSPVKAK